MPSCPRCRKEVPAGVRFCGFCRKKQIDVPERAQPLPHLAEGLECSSCTFLNARAFRCCVQCGAWLDVESEKGGLERGGTVPRKAGAQVGQGPDGAHRLLRLLPDGGVEEHRVLDHPLTIGRDGGHPGSAIRIPDDTFLSHRHAEVVRRDGRYWLRDLDSTNGTFIRIGGECELRPGDQILIGGSLFKFVV